jgi:uncharacterized protein YbjT (DUF2867 family)
MDNHLDKFCKDLPTKPNSSVGRILVTGANGYIGGELIPELQERGYSLRLMVREIKPIHRKRWLNSEIVEADVFDQISLKDALKGIDTVYYLIHSLHLRGNKILETENIAANNFRMAAEEMGVKRIIYLGGLGEENEQLSPHLTSRDRTAKELAKGPIPLTYLRAAVIIGSGSVSFTIINQLVSKCPIFIFPCWASSKCQPIAIRDVIKYLVGCLEVEETSGKTFHIGGPDVITYSQMIRIQAITNHKKRIFINSSLSSISLYARIASLITPSNYNITKTLMESCLYDVVCKDNAISEHIPFKRVSYKDALIRAQLRTSHKEFYDSYMRLEDGKKGQKQWRLTPPKRSKNLWSDIKQFLIHKPKISTWVQLKGKKEKASAATDLLHRLGIDVGKYKVLNLHKIGVNAPSHYIFDELLNWNSTSSCWPNHIAKVSRSDNKLEHLKIHLFGWTKYPFNLKKAPLGLNYIPLFELNALHFQHTPDSSLPDSARYLLYETSGGYPIGFFTLYTRSSIEEYGEKEMSQLYLMVGFNFFGKQVLRNWTPLNRLWEAIHNRVTSNVISRIKQLSEWRFEKMKDNI